MTVATLINASNSAVGAVTANTAASAVTVLPPSAAPTTPVSAAAVVSNASGGVASPHAVIDASTGVVVQQYLNTDGTLQSQSPSSAVIAYLRAGLTPDGLSKASISSASA